MDWLFLFTGIGFFMVLFFSLPYILQSGNPIRASRICIIGQVFFFLCLWIGILVELCYQLWYNLSCQSTMTDPFHSKSALSLEKPQCTLTFIYAILFTMMLQESKLILALSPSLSLLVEARNLSCCTLPAEANSSLSTMASMARVVLPSTQALDVK